MVSRNIPEGLASLSSKYKGKLFLQKADLSLGVPIEIADADYFLIASTPTSREHGNQDKKSVLSGAKILSSFFETNFIVNSTKEVSALHLSSGAIYRCHGKTRLPYNENQDLNFNSDETYVSAKVILETTLKKLADSNKNFKVSNPRLFAFYGPGLPLTEHFAMENFMKDAHSFNKVRVLGNPYSTRSYLHVADLSLALLRLLIYPCDEALNLGSDQEICMKDLATVISEEFDDPGVELLGEKEAPSYYVAEITKATEFLGKIEEIEFREVCGIGLNVISSFEAKVVALNEKVMPKYLVPSKCP